MIGKAPPVEVVRLRRLHRIARYFGQRGGPQAEREREDPRDVLLSKDSLFQMLNG
jgi:hypothetical protein